jgi:hypothetical protein
MSKKSKSNSLLNDMSYLNIGDLDVSKKGSTNNPKHRYEKNEKGSAPSFPNDGFYFNGQTVYPDEQQVHQQQQPKNFQLTKDDFVLNPSKNKNTSKGGMAHMIADEANAYHEDQEEEDEEAEDYDDGQEGAAGAYYPDDEEIEKNIKAPEMPTEYYQQIDHFLKKPPPKFQIDDPKDPKNKKKKKPTDNNNSRTHQQQQQQQQEAPYFPPIHQTSYDLYQQEYKGMVGGGGPPRIPDEEEQEQQSEEDEEEEDEYYQQQQQQQYGKPPRQQQQQQPLKKKKNNPDQVYQNPINPHKSSKPRSIDPHLLKEAFAYTDQLLREAVIEEANSMINDPEAKHPGPHQNNKKGNKQPKSAPSDMMDNASRAREMEEAYHQNHQEERKGASHGGGSKKKSSSNKMGIVRNLKQQQSQQQSLQSNRDISSQKNLHSSGFSVNTNMGETEGRDYKSNPVNYEDLVYNFQHGVNLDKLRRELTESKSSLATSEQLIRDLSSQFLRKK